MRQLKNALTSEVLREMAMASLEENPDLERVMSEIPLASLPGVIDEVLEAAGRVRANGGRHLLTP